MPARFDYAKLDAAIAVLNQAARDGVSVVARGSALALALDVIERRAPSVFSQPLWIAAQEERGAAREPITDDLLVDRATRVLFQAMLDSTNAEVRTPGVSLALRILRGRCPDEDLSAFWDDAGPAHRGGHRYAALTARYNRICRALGRAP